MLIINSRQEARNIAAKIHEWRKQNIPRYNATSWANENLNDEEYDKINKSEMRNLWAVPEPHDAEQHAELMGLCSTKTGREKVGKLPDGWRTLVAGGYMLNA